MPVKKKVPTVQDCNASKEEDTNCTSYNASKEGINCTSNASKEEGTNCTRYQVSGKCKVPVTRRTSNLRWTDCVEADFKVLRVTYWKDVAKQRMELKRLLRRPSSTMACRANRIRRFNTDLLT
ncbi:hypothetical protein CEXT_516241 [Caerostris extrusa]|uniref:Pleiotrophin/Midkine C-terminal domain-containing protein n=1 Tax=Caerostris extrusa TaxID=172846 RepID=A0AAV4NCT6_CAEEX|nr:hypothetical protein CEXT_516241 [Caerostris extrusa]